MTRRYQSTLLVCDRRGGRTFFLPESEGRKRFQEDRGGVSVTRLKRLMSVNLYGVLRLPGGGERRRESRIAFTDFFHYWKWRRCNCFMHLGLDLWIDTAYILKR